MALTGLTKVDAVDGDDYNEPTELMNGDTARSEQQDITACTLMLFSFTLVYFKGECVKDTSIEHLKIIY